jgi:predicted secreted hydrolase
LEEEAGDAISRAVISKESSASISEPVPIQVAFLNDRFGNSQTIFVEEMRWWKVKWPYLCRAQRQAGASWLAIQATSGTDRRNYKVRSRHIEMVPSYLMQGRVSRDRCSLISVSNQLVSFFFLIHIKSPLLQLASA